MPGLLRKHRKRLVIGTFFVMRAPAAHQLQLGVALFAKEHGGIDLRRWDFRQWPSPRALASLGLDGIIAQFFSHVKRVSPKSCPVPLVNVSNQMRHWPLPRIGADESGIGEAVGEYFLRRGYRHFAYCGHAWHWGSGLRQQGFRRAIERAGFSVDNFDLGPFPDEVTSFSQVREYKRHRAWLRGLPRPCAVMCFNDEVATLLLQNALDLGQRVPQDLAVMGVDNIPFRTHQSSVSLSSVDVGFVQIGYEAAAALVKHLENPRVPIGDRVVRAFKIISRRSTDAFAVDDELVSAAIDFIDENRSRRVSVTDVARAVAVSRRVLERRFRAKMGFSVYDVVQNSRLTTAQNLLRSTDLPLKEIAETAGFRSAQHLSVAFRTRLNTTPTRHRLEGAGVL